MTPVIVLITSGSQEEARTIARVLVEERLAACVNIVPGIESHYRWQGKLETAFEWLLLVKSSREQFDALSARVKALHSYDCPEIVAVAPEAVEPAYLKWWDGESSAAR